MDTREEGTRGEGTERGTEMQREEHRDGGTETQREEDRLTKDRGGGGDRDPGEMKTRMGK